jgi:hypothetical protein
MSTEDFIAILDFGTHAFEDARHMENFIKYLFSQSMRHRANELTHLNAVSINGFPDIFWNADPRNNAKNFLAAHRPPLKNWSTIFNDGAYISFICSVNNQTYSNLITGHQNRDDTFTHSPIIDSFYDELKEFMGPDQLNREIHNAIGASKVVMNWDLAPAADRLEIERRCHQAANEQLSGTAYITISHNDQKDHNQHYHIHRLRDRLPGEVATVDVGWYSSN